ncbi:IclR family transcriptional regulator [Azospirillum doebereinerae]
MTVETDQAEQAGGPRSALRVMGILEALAAERTGLTLAKLCDRLQLPKTSVFSLLRSLEWGGYVQSDNGRYTLGDQALRLGAAMNQTQTFPNSVRPVLEWLGRETAETVLLAVSVEQGQEIVYVDVIESESPLRFAIRPGSRRPLYCTAPGKAMLAFLPAQFQTSYLERTKFVRFTPDSLSEAELAALLPEIRRRGIFVDVNSIIDGATGIASPCFDGSGNVSCAITVAGPTARLLEARERIERLVLEAARRMSRILGYNGPYPLPE